MSEDCGCCTTAAAAIPAEVKNRPGLSAIAYRIGTFATFRKAITDKLAHTPELAGLSARVSDDYTITAIELWSAVADVLTFYQEPTANEAFLGTATLRDSVLRLVRLIDYQLRPGAAATTNLAFTLESGASALIPAGTRVQSIPGEGQKPQKFETLAPVAADARINRLRVLPAPTMTLPTNAGSASVIVAPDADALAAAAMLAAGDRVMFYAESAVEVLTVREVRARDDMLVVSWMVPIKGNSFEAAYHARDPACRAHKLGRSFHVFGFDAPSTVVVPEQVGPADPTTYLTTARTDYSLHGDQTQATQISLDRRYPGLKPGAIVLAVATLSGATTAIPFEVAAVNETHVARAAVTTTTPVTSQSGTVTQLNLTPLGQKTLADLLPANTDDDDIRNVVVHHQPDGNRRRRRSRDDGPCP